MSEMVTAAGVDSQAARTARGRITVAPPPPRRSTVWGMIQRLVPLPISTLPPATFVGAPARRAAASEGAASA